MVLSDGVLIRRGCRGTSPLNSVLGLLVPPNFLPPMLTLLLEGWKMGTFGVMLDKGETGKT
jgi:hypothetical protein